MRFAVRPLRFAGFFFGFVFGLLARFWLHRLGFRCWLFAARLPAEWRFLFLWAGFGLLAGHRLRLRCRLWFLRRTRTFLGTRHRFLLTGFCALFVLGGGTVFRLRLRFLLGGGGLSIGFGLIVRLRFARLFVLLVDLFLNAVGLALKVFIALFGLRRSLIVRALLLGRVGLWLIARRRTIRLGPFLLHRHWRGLVIRFHRRHRRAFSALALHRLVARFRFALLVGVWLAFALRFGFAIFFLFRILLRLFFLFVLLVAWRFLLGSLFLVAFLLFLLLLVRFVLLAILGLLFEFVFLHRLFLRRRQFHFLHARLADVRLRHGAVVARFEPILDDHPFVQSNGLARLVFRVGQREGIFVNDFSREGAVGFALERFPFQKWLRSQ